MIELVIHHGVGIAADFEREIPNMMEDIAVEKLGQGGAREREDCCCSMCEAHFDFAIDKRI